MSSGSAGNLRALVRALSALGIATAEIAPLVNDEPWTPDVRTFLVIADSGERLKARISLSARAAATSSRLTAQLADPRLPIPVARWGRITFERWVEGTALHVAGWSESELVRAAELLGAVHCFAGTGGEHLPQLRATRPLVEQSLSRLTVLREAGLIDRPLTRRIAALVRDGIPERRPWAVVHGDLAAANLILTESGRLVSIDNERLSRGFLDLDLGVAWHRWPLEESEQRVFDAAYASATGRSPTPEIALWRLLATVRRLWVGQVWGGDTTGAWRRFDDALNEI